MKSLFKFMTLSVLWTCILLLPIVATGEEMVIARVGSVPITQFELQREINQLVPYRVAFHGGIAKEKLAEIEGEALNKLIERAYKICYAQQMKLSIPEERVDSTIEDVQKKFKTAADFERAVETETLAGLRASIYRALLAQKAEELAVEDRLTVTEEQLRDHYQRHLQAFFRPEQFRASHILIKVDPALSAADKTALKERATDLLEQLDNGEEFYQLAYYHSDDRTKYVGGDLGFFHAGQTVPEFEEALKGLEVGQHSRLVKTRFGYHIVKLTEMNPARQLEFSEVSEKIREQFMKQQRDDLYRKWLTPLKSQYQVENPAI